MLQNQAHSITESLTCNQYGPNNVRQNEKEHRYRQWKVVEIACKYNRHQDALRNGRHEPQEQVLH